MRCIALLDSCHFWSDLSTNEDLQNVAPGPLSENLFAAYRANYTVTIDGWPSSADPSPEKPSQAEGFSPSGTVTAEPSPPKSPQAGGVCPGGRATADASPKKPPPVEDVGQDMDGGDPETPEKASEPPATKTEGRGQRRRIRSRSIPPFAIQQPQLLGDKIDLCRTIENQ